MLRSSISATPDVKQGITYAEVLETMKQYVYLFYLFYCTIASLTFYQCCGAGVAEINWGPGAGAENKFKI